MWVRCSKCQSRRSLRYHPDTYARLPRCRTYGCTNGRRAAGKRQTYYVDHYRQRVERNGGPKAKVCVCSAYHFPHRAESGTCWLRYIPEPTKGDTPMRYILPILILALTGCGEPTKSTIDVDVDRLALNQRHNLERVVDRELGVVCYVGRSADAVSCVPMPERAP